MLDLPPATVNDFLTTFKGLMEQAERQAPPEEEPVFLQRLRAHFGQEPTRLPILSEQFKRADHPNLHLALTSYVTTEGRAHELYGITMPNDHAGIRLVIVGTSQVPFDPALPAPEYSWRRTGL